MKKRLSILNLSSVILVILINYASQSLRFNETTIGEVSNTYFNLFTPAGYAFAIWGLIFIALIAYGIFQIRLAYNNENSNPLIEQTSYWFIAANLLNCMWVFAFSFDYTGLSVLIMLGILICLLQIIVKTNMNQKPTTRSIKLFGWLPIGMYSGWISVATIANIAAYFSKLNWNGAPFSEVQWTIIMIVIATIVNVYMLWKRNSYVFAMVGVWALVAIYVRHSSEINPIATVALICAILLGLLIVIGFIKKPKMNSISNPTVDH